MVPGKGFSEIPAIILAGFLARLEVVACVKFGLRPKYERIKIRNSSLCFLVSYA